MGCIEAEGHVPVELQPTIDECMDTLIDCDMNALLMEVMQWNLYKATSELCGPRWYFVTGK